MNKKILIVEDDAFLREIYIDTLKNEGFKLDTAVDGEEGYQKMKNGEWDLVLLDIILPKLNGLDVVKKLQTEPGYKSLKIVFLTNLDKSEEIKEALRLGSGYLIKSQLTPGDFLKEVKLYLSKV